MKLKSRFLLRKKKYFFLSTQAANEISPTFRSWFDDSICLKKKRQPPESTLTRMYEKKVTYFYRFLTNFRDLFC